MRRSRRRSARLPAGACQPVRRLPQQRHRRPDQRGVGTLSGGAKAPLGRRVQPRRASIRDRRSRRVRRCCWNMVRRSRSFCAASGRGPRPTISPTWPRSKSARTRAYHAADAAPLPREAFSAVPADEWPELCIDLHPSVALLKSDFPVVSIWQANLYSNDNTLDVWKPECALIARPILGRRGACRLGRRIRIHRGAGGRPDCRCGDRAGLGQGAGLRPRRMLQCR